jgi:hypothetical protein
MKLNKCFILTLIITFYLLNPSTSHAQGSSVGNGGKGINAYLTDAIVQLNELLIEKCNDKSSVGQTWRSKACAVSEPLFNQIMKTKIMSAYIVYGKIDHLPRDAINDTFIINEKPVDAIVYSIRKLKEADPALRRRIILHEFMTLAGFETSDSYGYSTVVLRFISDAKDFETILNEMPEIIVTEKTFSGLEVTITQGDLNLPILIESSQDYQNFCIAKGFLNFGSIYLSDISYAEWLVKNAQAATISTGIAKLNTEGFITQTVLKPDGKARVIDSVTCK